jgi:hypothetical protein
MASKKAKSSRRKFLQHTASIGLGLAAFPVLATATTSDLTGKLATVDYSTTGGAVDLAIQNLIAEGLDDVFPRPFELDLLATDAILRRDVSAAVTTQLSYISSQRAISATRAMLVPKEKPGEYRTCLLIDPMEAVRYLALAILIAKSTTPQRSSKAFSYRYDPHGSRLFDLGFDSERFQAAVLSRLSNDRKTWLVRTDIKDFYPSIRLDRLRRALREQQVEPWCIDAVLEMLGGWKNSFGGGVPVGPAASHILAEAVLIGVDKRLTDDGIDHIRFVDDYRLFAPDAATAHAWLGTLEKRLAAEGLQLRPDKTSIDSISRSDYENIIEHRKRSPFFARGEIDQQPPPTPPQPTPPQPQPNCPPSGCRRPRRPPPRSDIERFKQLDARLSLAGFLAADEAYSAAAFRLFAEASYWRGEFALIESSIDVLDRSPHCIPYLVDLLMQESSAIPATTRASFAALIGQHLNSGRSLSDLDVLKIAKLLGCAAYRNPQALVRYLRSMAPGYTSIATRYLLEALGMEVDRQTAWQLVAQFEKAGPWEQRAALRLALPHLGDKILPAYRTRRPPQLSGDLLLQSIVAETRRAAHPA